MWKECIERVWQIAKCSKLANAVFISTDSDKIAQHAESFGASVIMTPSDCPTGTDRVAHASKQFAHDNTIVISLQGDAVLTPPWVLDQMIDALIKSPESQMVTPAVKLTKQSLTDFLEHKKVSPSSGTTVTFNINGDALYFSKQPIPYLYSPHSQDAALYRHIGLYGYRYKTLTQLQSLPQSPIEKLEKLEQLRALENNIPIRVVCVDYQGRTHGSVDTPADIAFVENIISKEGELVA